MIFRRRKHPLPSFPPSVAPTFQRQCERLAPEQLEQFTREFEGAVDGIYKSLSGHGLIKKSLVDELIEISRFLLSEHPRYSPEQGALIVGAIRYFVDPHDGLSEASFASGLQDDIGVFNYVLEELGLDDRYIVPSSQH